MLFAFACFMSFDWTYTQDYYFRVNYLIVLVLVLATSLLLRSLSLLLVASLAGAWLLLYVLRPPEQKLVIFGRGVGDLICRDGGSGDGVCSRSDSDSGGSVA